MASVAKGFRYGDYLSLAGRRAADIEKMSPRARKAYLHRQLHEVEAQIGSMVDRLTADAEEASEVFAGPEQLLSEQRWSSLFDLGYLMAEREALAEAIDRL